MPFPFCPESKKPFLPRFLLAVLALLFSSSAYNQNLVPNPGFEEYVTQPCSWIGTQSDLSAVQEDWLILSGSPDIFSSQVSASCFAYCCGSTEYNAVGYEQPHSGNFMAGIITYGAGMGLPHQYREGFEVQLTSPLVVGQEYYAEMYVSLADNSFFASNNIGLYFSETFVPFDINNTGPLYFEPQVKGTSIVDEMNGWVKISGTFVADTPAEYLLIDNFTDDSLTDVFHLTGEPDYGKAYYFIDDILVKPTCLSVGSDHTICQNESATITAASPAFNGWALASDPAVILSTDPAFTVSPQVTTTYLAFADCDTFPVTVLVQTVPPDLFLGSDTIICEGTTLILQATAVNGSYEWQDGSAQPSYDVTTAGTYWLKETNQCGTTYSEIYVGISPLPKIPLEPLTWLCEGSSLLLYEIDPTLKTYYVDSTGNYVSTQVITAPGMYNVQAQNDCGYFSKTIFVEMVDCEGALAMPNVVTPNGDQVNDLLVPTHLKGISTMKTTLFNRWGEVVFETNNPAIEWDGSDHTEGVYFWKVEYVDLGMKQSTLQGFFYLVK
jgi:gliding motility-associated-like protein